MEWLRFRDIRGGEQLLKKSVITGVVTESSVAGRGPSDPPFGRVLVQGQPEGIIVTFQEAIRLQQELKSCK